MIIDLVFTTDQGLEDDDITLPSEQTIGGVDVEFTKDASIFKLGGSSISIVKNVSAMPK